MKTFDFRLARLLDLRRIEEAQSASALRRAAARLAEADERLAQLRRDHAELFRELADALARRTALPEEPMHAAVHAGRLERVIREAERARAECAQSVVAAELELRKRRAAMRALEELEHKARAAWNEESRREENAWLDEVASIRHAARMR